MELVGPPEPAEMTELMRRAEGSFAVPATHLVLSGGAGKITAIIILSPSHKGFQQGWVCLQEASMLQIIYASSRVKASQVVQWSLWGGLMCL